MCSLASPCTPCGAGLRSLRLPLRGRRTHVPRLSGTAFRERRLKPLGNLSVRLLVRSYQFACPSDKSFGRLGVRRCFSSPDPELRTYKVLLSLKKAFKISVHSFSRIPRSTFTLWFTPFSFNNLNFDSTAPNFGSNVPKTNLDILL